MADIAAASVKILVLEDDDDTRAVIAIALRAYDFSVIEAADGLEGKELLLKENPDLVIADLMMPKVSGLEFIKWLKQSEQIGYTPVLILSALGDIDDRIRGFETGADDYLVKPFQHLELKARIDALLRVKSLITELRQKNEDLENTTRELENTQTELLKAERKVVGMQLAATAAHNFGQPLTAALFSFHVLERELMELNGQWDGKFAALAKAVKEELVKMELVLEKIRDINPDKTSSYIGDISLLTLGQEN